jgi:CheY-like chemotaxis protein
MENKSDGKKIKILFVDDYPDILRDVKILVELEGYEVITALNGREGLEIILQSEPTPERISLVVTDLEMPVMSGLELIREIRKLERLIPIFLAPASVNEDMLKGLVPKDVIIIEKPYLSDELIDKIKEIL